MFSPHYLHGNTPQSVMCEDLNTYTDTSIMALEDRMKLWSLVVNGRNFPRKVPDDLIGSDDWR